MRRTTSSLRNVVCGPGHIKCIYSSTYSGFYIQLIVSSPLLEICRQFSVRYTANMVLIQRTAFRLHNVNCGPGHIHCKYSSAYSGFNIQLRVSALILELCRQLNAPSTANIVPNTAHILHITLCEMWSPDIQCNYSSAYAGFNIQLNVSVLLLEIYRQFNACYTASLVPNTAHIVHFKPCEL
jgi:hypothetical protein